MELCNTCGVLTTDVSGTEQTCFTCRTKHHLANATTDTGNVAEELEPPLVRLRRGDWLEGRWRIEEKLGEGGMGVVMRAQEPALGRRVAIKFLSHHLCAQPTAVSRFEREGRLTAQLDHPNIVPVYAVGNHHGRPFIVMKHLDGMPLSRYLKIAPPPLPMNEVLSLMRQLCAGLEHLHSRGFVHRDIKPANLFFSPSGHLTVLDLGILWDPAAEQLTRTGQQLGTPAYMAPEYYSPNPVDHRADVYAAGVVLFELLTGARSTPGTSALVIDTSSLSELSPWVTPALAEVVEKATNNRPERRFQSAPELWRALEAAVVAPSLAPPHVPRRAGLWRRRWALVSCAGLVGAAALALYAPRTPAPAPAYLLPAVSPRQATRPVVLPGPQVVASPEPAPAPVASHEKKELPARRRSSAANASPSTSRSSGRLRVMTLERGQPTWALWSLDGAHRGGTPAALDVAAGHHRVRVERQGYRTVEKDVQVASGQLEVVRIELTH
jgi:serine/threonine protein kinase